MIEVIESVKDFMDNFVILGLLGSSVCFFVQAVRNANLTGKRKRRKITVSTTHDKAA